MSGRPGESFAFSRGLPATLLRCISLCQIASSEKGCTEYYPVGALAALSCGCNFAVRYASAGCSRRSSLACQRGSLSRPVAVVVKEKGEKIGRGHAHGHVHERGKEMGHGRGEKRRECPILLSVFLS
ncbi:MAG: hypothetical protein HYX48_01065 [Chlamydiales bacterium]|nr:hypothetical protein [Chlamydiales bacterium]